MTLPKPRRIDGDATPALRWGIIGTGWIATRFVRAVHRRTAQRVAAVTARDPYRLSSFATTHDIPTSYPTPEALLADESIDAVYIATPHSSHRDLALQAIAAGKPVLVEKPIALSAAEAREIATAARAAGVLVMEAMWTRYLPQIDIVRQMLDDGTLGDIHLVTADFGFVAPYDPGSRMWDPTLGGGALLDAGVYPVSFASFVLGAPARVQASGEITPDGVDLRASAILTSPGRADAFVATSMVAHLPTRATVIGTKGRIDIPASFFTPTGVVLTTRADGTDVTESWTDDTFEDGYDALSYQALAFASYLAEGRPESPLHTLDEVVSTLATIDAIRGLLTVDTEERQ
ncbi:putative dehydrogenase [Promicromonospora sp. AC04]|uniref:Gfo/Idh/MocA family protein n=1 Tax=Promicromonospora sp. AC04 TaxID=2135723 RepID=UPI000D39E910|nr:Gfo/Idh/MocA family oxidoreductase [Promicromonospora sp. AC04]PUB27666.1 putative dehydrogenase [Promicromonospora sp. AC04]